MFRLACFAAIISLAAGAPTENGSELSLSSEMQYSPLRQITPVNVNRLARSWTYHTGEKGRQFETTPIFAGGLLYISSQSAKVIALQPETGKEVWKYDPHLTRSKDHRGVSYW